MHLEKSRSHPGLFFNASKVHISVLKFIFSNRLWGDHGQSLLESGHVCLINASATGTETLKSLVLPGLGAVTIIDDAKVAPQDTGNK